MSERLALFVLASVVLAVTPGAGVAYIVTRTLAQGRRTGLASVLGIAVGNLGNGIAAALGLALLFETLPAALAVVKLVGAGYLAFLGVRALRARDADAAPEAKPASTGSVVRDGFLVALLNPKTALFFAAFLPQFVDTSGSAIAQSLILVSIFIGIAAVSDAGYVMAASVIAPWLRGARAHAVMRWVPALVFFALALFAATS